MIGFCFFKQKTAYEMRISDWSSDVCSSDLRRFSDRAPLIRPIGFAQATLEYLAGILAGKVGFEPDHLGNLVAGQAAGQAPLDSRRIPRRFLVRFAIGAYRFADFGVGNAEYRAEIGRASVRESVCQYV